jgi:hypothetical protein
MFTLTDSLPPEMQPTIIVQSGHGYHLYWPLEESLTGERVWEAEPVLRGIVECLQADGSVAEIARIMRLPGTLNLKSQPFQECKVVSHKPGKFSFEKMKVFFKPSERTSEPAFPLGESIEEGRGGQC